MRWGTAAHIVSVRPVQEKINYHVIAVTFVGGSPRI
jgi:hypothetical protein